MLADNKLGELAEWDDSLLSELAAEHDLDLTALGWSDEEAAGLLGSGEEVKEEGEDAEVEPDDGPPDSQPGMVYELGPHRLACGDSTKPETWAALMGGERWAMLMTSPPYGQQRDYGAAKEHVQDWRGLMAGVFGSAVAHAEPDGQMLVNLGLVHRECRVVRYWDDWIADMDAMGWYMFGWYVWDQGWGLPMTSERGRLMPSHEFVFHIQRQRKAAAQTVPKKAENIGARVKSGMRRRDGTVTGWASPEASESEHKVPDSVVRIKREMGDVRSEHPAVYPVAFPAELIPVWADRGSIVAEPFGGSGTTLIACAMIGRVARLIELDPKYCDVIRRRWTRWARENGRDPGPGALEARDG